jgi:2,4-dienoyl-CoA reductase-like NADH-dependent reductase (Old Yellow Enzyme family)/thioredoxin reductase
MNLNHLFSPIKINTMELKNRAVMPAMATGYTEAGGIVGERLTAYLERRAAGGTGLIITEICAVDPRGRNFPNEIGIWDDSFLPGLAKIPAAVHRHGAKAAAQLHHAGRETMKMIMGEEPEAPSDLPSVVLQQPCQAMSLERVSFMVDAYAKAAGRARKAGFDAVEIHGAHGYLVGQFLSPFSNRRTDEYGGSDENRARFALDIVRAVRREVSSDFTVLIRLSTDELVRGGYDINFITWLAPQLVEAGVDAIHASVGVYSTPGNLSIASMDTDEGFNLFRARAVKQAVSVPVIGVGRVHDPRIADAAIARGDADLVSMGRQHLTDPDFLNKAREGRFDDIRWCIACNQGCIDRLSFEMKSATCVFNPECGREFKGSPASADKPGKVWVIGAGPAGLSAALAASSRGHAVEIFERDKTPGGQLHSASKPPHKESFWKWVSWAQRELGKKSVPVHGGIAVTDDVLRKGKPDAVILASGAAPSVPPIPGIDGPRVHDARNVLEGKVEITGPAVVLGAGYVGMETADFLIARGIAPTVLEMAPQPQINLFSAHGYWLTKRFKEGNGKLVLSARVTSIAEDTVIYEKEGAEQKLQGVGMIITALGAREETGLVPVLDALKIPYLAAGDVKKPRRLLEAIHEGARAGEEI